MSATTTNPAPAAEALLRLSLIPGLGPITAQTLLTIPELAAEPLRLFQWPMRELLAVEGIGPERAARIRDVRLHDLAAEERRAAAALGVRIITQADADYPRFLTRLPDPPLALWLSGAMEARDELALAVVGPRRPSAYGHRQGQRFAKQLASLGVTIVSGLARGIDTVAHRAALEAGGRTIAVLGSGFGHLYPAENAGLAAEIAAGRGAVLSEYPLATRPSPGTFPRRNRIVAALALGTLVVEAGVKSGALITARLAGELGKEILVIPGPIDRPEHEGSHRLIRDGATLVASIDDVLQEVPPLATLAAPQGNPEPKGPSSLNERERQLYVLLGDEPRGVDDLQRLTGHPASVVSATLIALELRRLARRQPGGFVKAL
jgi:DNA processing protein